VTGACWPRPANGAYSRPHSAAAPVGKAPAHNRHDELSPISYASAIRTPVLILHGRRRHQRATVPRPSTSTARCAGSASNTNTSCTPEREPLLPGNATTNSTCSHRTRALVRQMARGTNEPAMTPAGESPHPPPRPSPGPSPDAGGGPAGGVRRPGHPGDVLSGVAVSGRGVPELVAGLRPAPRFPFGRRVGLVHDRDLQQCDGVRRRADVQPLAAERVRFAGRRSTSSRYA